ncbi:MAG: signal peptide peptidase SppA [Mariprofundaceae bacterium]|nr:signal peptide peptidase SppA [Mariprofundaceae bacterium]
MKNFFSRVGRFFTIIKNILVSLLVILLLVEIIALIVFSQPSLPDSGVLVFAPQGSLVEQIREPAADKFPFAFPDPDQTRVRDVIKVLHAAAKDPRVLALELNLEGMSEASLSKVQDIRKAIIAFKTSGKPVLAAQYNYTQAQYLLASTADEVWLHPMGSIALGGIGVYRNYFRDALDKLNVDIHIFRAGKYKSAVEPLMRNSMSKADHDATQVWMDSMWHIIQQGIMDTRGVSPEHLQDLLDHPARYLKPHAGDMAALLKEEKLIDQIGEPREAERQLAIALGFKKRSDMETMAFKDYQRTLSHSNVEKGKNHVVIITASGTIVSGNHPAGVIGSETLADLLDEAADDDQVRAVVLRIDSPGGSAQASEVIRTAVTRVQAKGKPVVVSMGSLAASGGYWIAAGADEIWAQPSTITGSIGVFGIIPNITKGLEQLGIHSDGLGTSRSAEGIRLDRPIPPEMQKVIQMGVDHIYHQFVTVVANGRNITPKQVNALAQGRVWAANDALRLGLVDQLGGIRDAVKSAAKRASISDDYQVYDLTPPKGWAAMLARSLFGSSTIKMPWSDATWLTFMPSGIRQQLEPLGLLLKEPTSVYAYSAIVVDI